MVTIQRDAGNENFVESIKGFLLADVFGLVMLNCKKFFNGMRANDFGGFVTRHLRIIARTLRYSAPTGISNG